MSLLLDALYKASKDKEKAAELSLVPLAPEAPSAETPAQAEIALELAASEPLPSPVLSAVLDVPFPSLELELEPHPSDIEVKAPTPPAPAQLVKEPPKQEARPEPEPEPEKLIPALPSASVTPLHQPLPAAKPEVSTPISSTQTAQPPPATTKQTSKIAQILSRVQSRSAKVKSKPNRRTQVLGGMALALLIAVGGLYVFLSLDAASLPHTMANQPAPAMPQMAAVPLQDMATATGQTTPTSPQPNENAMPAAMQSRPLPANAAEIAQTAKKNERNNELAAVPKAATASNDERSGETFLRPSTPKSVFTAKPSKPSALEVGYAALVDGRLEEAAQAYAQALKTNTQERDALLGMAYIAHQRGQREDALAYYQRVLRQDPSNALATAAVLTLDAALEPAAASLRALDLAARQPDSVAALTAAANALVRDGKLAEAAPIFARAQGLEPENALHAYNHAVALDRLGQVVPAIEQYQRVLKIADRHLPTGVRPFSLESVRLRLQELNQSQTLTSENTP